MKKIFTLFFLLLNYVLFAQNGVLHAKVGINSQQPGEDTGVQTERNCGTMNYLAKMLQENPALAQQMQQNRNSLAAYAAANGDALAQQKIIYNIPVVVHVIYKNATQNISNAQVQSQIDVLNKDFRKLNTDVGQVPSVWTSLVADVGIQFCLASIDPNGANTTGITNTSAPAGTTFDDSNENMKYTATGGHDAWNTQKYLNLWVCDLAGSLLGYAQFPGSGSPNTDGVVIDYTDFGTMGTAVAPFNLGRTATHEVGHWLGLLHIWGDEPACGNDDQVTDTPQQKDKNFGCPTYPQTTQAGGRCSTNDPSSMFMNYMDYVNDACMYMFSNGQKVKMLAALTQQRAGLITSNGCSSVPNPTTCDSISNFLNTDVAQVYTPASIGSGGSGYIAGTNSFGDVAKADKYTPTPNLFVKGMWINFGGIYATNGGSNTLNYCIWDDDGANGSPNTQLASQSVTMLTIYNNILAPSSPAYVQFPSLVPVTGSFYGGISFNPTNGDTIIIYTNTLNATANNGWEKASDNTWHAYTETPVSWGINLSHAIYPVMCPSPTTASNYLVETNTIEIFPNPADDKLYIHLGDKAETKNYRINVLNMLGEVVNTQMVNNVGKASTLSIETNALPNGIYLLEIFNGQDSSVKKFNIVH